MSILETIEKGTLSFQKEKGVYQKFYPNTEAELVTMKNGKDAEAEIKCKINIEFNLSYWKCLYFC